jgi:hypothetical protein
MRVSFVENLGFSKNKSRDNHGCDCNGVILFNRNGLRKEIFLAPAGIRREKVRKARRCSLDDPAIW